MCSDIDDEGLIIYEKNLAPKTYCHESINSKNKLAINDLCTMKAKVIPKERMKEEGEKEKILKKEFYLDGKEHKVLNLMDSKKFIRK